MAGPWEQYQEAAGPWTQYQQPQAEGPWTQFQAEQPPAEPEQPPAEPEQPDATFGESLADIGLGAQRGALTIFDAAIDAFGGADSEFSKFAKRADAHLAALLSEEGQADAARAAQIIADAEGKGIGAELKAGLQAVAADPSGIISQAAGSAVPFIATSLLGTPALIGLGATTGAGIIKGGIYDTVESELLKAGIEPEKAKAAAEQAQAYGGENLDQILIGTVLGAGAAVGPVEKLLVNRLSGNIASRIAKGAVAEAIPEAAQAGQEKFAQNLALQREGFDVDLGAGVTAQAVMEGAAAAPLGGIAGIPRQPEALPPTVPPTEPPTAPPAPTEYDPDAFEAEYQRAQAAGATPEEAILAAGRVASGLAQPREPEVEDVEPVDVGGVEPSIPPLGEPTAVEPVEPEPAAVEAGAVEPVTPSIAEPISGEGDVNAALTQRLDALQIPKGAPLRRRLKGTDISTNEGFEKLQSELRAYAANPRSNAAARTRISEVLAAGEEAAAPLAAMEEQVAESREPTPEVAPEGPLAISQDFTIEPEVDQTAVEEGRRMIERYEAAIAEGATEAEASALAQAAPEVEPTPAPAEVEAVAQEELPPSLVENILEQLQTRRATMDEEEYVSEANRAYNLAMKLEEDYGGTDLVRLRDSAQRKIADGVDVVDAYTQAEEELISSAEAAPKVAPEVTAEIKALRGELDTLAKEVGTDVAIDRILEPELSGIDEVDRLRIARRAAQLGQEKPEYNFFFPTQRIQKAFQDPEIQQEVQAARQAAKETRRVEAETLAETAEVQGAQARAARQLTEAQTAKEMQRELSAADRRRQRDQERQQLNRDTDADFKFISQPFDYAEEVQRLEKLNQTRRTADKIPVPNQTRMEAAAANRRIETLARAIRLLTDPNVSRSTKAAKTAQSILRHPSVTREELSSAYDQIQQVEARFVQVAMEQKYGPVVTEAIRSSRAEGVNSLAGEPVDQNILNAGTLQDALNSIRQTGTPFQKTLAARLSQVLRGVRLVVVNNVIGDVRDPVAVAEFMSDDPPAGLFYDDTIYLNNTTGANGVNPVILLHEALHAASDARIDALLTNPESLPAGVKEAITELRTLMDNARAEYEARKRAEVTSAAEDSLADIGAFSSLKEFIAYGITQPEMQTFLAGMPGVYGTEEQARSQNIFKRFIKFVRQMFNMAPNTQSAFEQLVAVTDQLIDGPKIVATPAQQASAARRVKREAEMIRRVAQSRKVDQLQKGAFDLLLETRNPKDARTLLGSLFNKISRTKLRLMLKVLDTDNIIRLGESKGISNLGEVGKTMQRLAGMRGALLKELAQNVQVWAGFNSRNPEGAATLADLMNLATITQVNPLNAANPTEAEAKDAGMAALKADLAKLQQDPTTTTRKLNAKKKEIDERREYIAEIYKMWDTLGGIANGKGREIFKTALEQYEKTFDTHMDLLMESIRKSGLEGDVNDPTTPKGKLMASIVKRFQEAKKQQTVYFPLMRFGEYWLSIGKGNNAEAYLFESEMARDFALQKRYEELRAAGMQKSLEGMLADGDIRIGVNNQDLKNELLDPSEGSKILRDIFTMLESSQVSDLEAVKDQVYQMFLLTLPDQDIRRRFLKRKARTGFTTDVLRSFIVSQQTAANQLSRLKYGPEVRAALGASYALLQGDAEAERSIILIDEIARRTNAELSPTPPNEDGLNFDRFARYGNQAVFFYMLSSIKSALIQATQYPIVAMPVLAARYGVTKTLGLTAKYMNVFNKLGVSAENPDGNIVTKWGPLTTYESSYVQGKPVLRRAWEAGQDRNLFLSTYASDMTSRRRQPTYKYEGLMSKGTRAAFNLMGGAFHHVERLVREHTYLIAFELEYEKQRKAGRSEDAAFQNAVDAATDVTMESLFNFENYNKPPIMKEGVGRLAFQFMTYPMQMTYFLARNFYGMLPFLDNKEKKAAATKFFGVMGMTYMFAGATGLPLYALMMGFMDGMKELFDFDGDDDDYTDPRNPMISSDLWFRRVFIPSLFGPNSSLAEALGLSKEQAEMMARAAELGPLSALTDINFNVSTTLGDLWYPQSLPGETSRDALQAFFYEYALGPFGSMAVGIADGYNSMMDGEFLRGLEKLSPAFIRGELKRQRILEEGGELTPSGNVVKDGEFFTVGKLFAQSLGFGSTEVGQIQTVNRLAKAEEREVLKLRKDLYDGLDRAFTKFNNQPTDENSERVNDAITEVLNYNIKYSMWPISSDDINKSLEGRAKSRALAMNGLVINPNLLPYLQDILPE